MNTINILSIDGGGVKGLIPSQILYRIEEELLKPNSKTLYTYFDVFAGSSAGSMIIGALVYKQASGTDLITKYMTPENIQYIMPKLHPPSNYVNETSGTVLLTLVVLTIFIGLIVSHEEKRLNITTLGLGVSIVVMVIVYALLLFVIWLYPPKYPGGPKKHMINSFVGDTLVGDTSKDVFITSYDITIQRPVFFRSWDPITNGYNIAEVIDASSAAPNFYPAVQIISKGGGNGSADPNSQPNSDYYIDGGVTTNNPTNGVYAYIIDKYKANVDTTKFNILSLGCGYELDLNSTKTASKNWGALTWLLSGNFQLFIGNEQTVTYIVQQFADARGDGYLRIDGQLTSSNNTLDNTDLTNLQELIQTGNKWFDTNICKLCTFFEVPIPSTYTCKY
jgi:hypothetical protein